MKVDYFDNDKEDVPGLPEEDNTSHECVSDRGHAGMHSNKAGLGTESNPIVLRDVSHPLEYKS